MSKDKLLIIDNEPLFFDTFCDRYEDTYDIELVRDRIRSLPKIDKGGWKAVVVDLDMGKGYRDGLSRFLPMVVKKAANRFPILVYSSDNSPQTTMLAEKAGAAAYLHKSKSNPKILYEKLKDLIASFNPNRIESSVASSFIVRSKKMLDIQKRLRILVNYPDVPVLILGETGVGKEVAARFIHESKQNNNLPFEAVNLSAFSSDLLRSEIFGHVKGAFTGAISNKKGLFTIAKGGTLFLDEIGELEETVQVQLLRVLEDRKYKQVGGLQDLDLDTHLIFATNRNLEEAMAEGSFRTDFYERISSLAITIPPLRERKEDIIPLAQHFLTKVCHKNHPLYQRKIQEAFTENALEKIITYAWPHNVRQLANTIQKLVFELEVQNDKIIDLSHLPPNIIKRINPFYDKRPETKENKKPLSITVPSSVQDYAIDKQTAYQELNRIEKALIQEGGRKDDAARVLGLKNDQTLRYKVKKKYFDQYPDLFEDFPTICKIYKLKV